MDANTNEMPGTAKLAAKAAAAALLAVFVVWTAFQAEGGLQLAKTTPVWVVTITLGGLVATISLFLKGSQKFFGGGALFFLTLFTLFTGLSISWSLIPSDSLDDFIRHMAYLSAFAGGLFGARAWRTQWRVLVVGLLLAFAAIVIYALLTKVLPGLFAEGEVYARLRAPFSYWNAVGLSAAILVPLSLWLATAEGIGKYLRTLAYPAALFAVVVLLFSYSRASLAVAVLVAAIWFYLVRTEWVKSLALLVVSAFAGAAVLAWGFAQPSLTDNGVSLALRESVGWKFGLILLVAAALTYLIGLAVDRWLGIDQIPDRSQSGIKWGVVAIAIAVPLVATLSLSLSKPGLSQRVSDAWDSITASEAEKGPPNSPARLTSISSGRFRYWEQAGKIWEEHPIAGAGAASYELVRKRYRKSVIFVAHAHGAVPQAMADLGLIGLALLLLIFVFWFIAAFRTLDIRWRRERPSGAEAAGMAAVAAAALALGIHTAIDWTWYVPGVAIPALIAAGWLVGRGPLSAEPPAVNRRSLARWIAPAFLAIFTVFAAVAAALPYRSDRAVEDALHLIESGKTAQARTEAVKARDLNPTSPKPYYTLSLIEKTEGNISAGEDMLIRAVRLQPANPLVWQRLGEYLLQVIGNAREAKEVFKRAIYLDPEEPTIQYLYISAERAAEQQALKRQLARLKAKIKRNAEKSGVAVTP